MMIELWGLVHVVTSPAMKPLWEWLGSFSQDIAQDLLKDFVKDDLIISNWQRLPFTAQGRTVIRSLKSFVAAMEQELDRLGCAPDLYIKPLKTFIKDHDGRALLGTALNLRQTAPDPIALADLWDELGVRSLPEGFDWSAVATAYRSAVQAIVRDSAELRSIAQFELTAQLLEGQQATADLLADRLGPAVDFDLEAYARSIQTTCGKLPLDQLATDGGAYSVKLWQVFLPQRARECGEYLPQLDKAPKELLRKYGLLQEELDEDQQEKLRDLYRRQAPRSVLELAADPAANLLVILGDPGSGKSTLLKYLALDWATYENELCRINDIRPLDQLLARPLPLLVELRLWARESKLDLLDYFHAGNVFDRLNKSQLHDRLIAGRALLLFDGLDEVFEPAQREAVIREICRVSRDYPATKIIVTSRVYGYQNYARSLTNHGFRHWLLEEFDDTQIKNFCDRWHQETFETSEKADRDRCRERLGNAIAERRTIRELAGNPLMMTMMCILNRESRLPDKRFKLYCQATDLLLDSWDLTEKKLPDPCEPINLKLEQKREILCRVALFLQNTEGGLAGNLIREPDLKRIIADYLSSSRICLNPEGWAEDLIEVLRVRSFILCSAGTSYYAFVHRTFLEYFCVEEIIKRFNVRSLENQSMISINDLVQSTFGQQWQDDAWREVLILLTSQLPVEAVKQTITLLAELDKSVSEEAGFANLFLAADCLAESPERSAILDLDRDLLQKLRSLTTWELLPNGHYQKVFSFLDFKGQTNKIRSRAISCVSQHWQNDPNTLLWLKDLAKLDEDYHVQRAALQVLTERWKDDLDTLPLLKDLACSDQDEYVRYVALQALAQDWQDDPETLPLLRSLARSEHILYVRYAVVDMLAQVGKDHPDTLPLFKDLARSDQHEYVRQAAIEGLLEIAPKNPQVIDLLRDRAANDPDDLLREWATKQLTTIDPQ